MDTRVPFPNCVRVHVDHPAPEGMAVDVCIHMRRMNHFHYMLFLDARGTAEVSGDQLCRVFDEERAAFIMDYADPRVAFTGQVTARALGAQDIARAMETLSIYQGHLEYPADYQAQLVRAASRGDGATMCSVEVTVA